LPPRCCPSIALGSVAILGRPLANASTRPTPPRPTSRRWPSASRGKLKLSEWVEATTTLTNTGPECPQRSASQKFGPACLRRCLSAIGQRWSYPGPRPQELVLQFMHKPGPNSPCGDRSAGQKEGSPRDPMPNRSRGLEWQVRPAPPRGGRDRSALAYIASPPAFCDRV